MTDRQDIPVSAKDSFPKEAQHFREAKVNESV